MEDGHETSIAWTTVTVVSNTMIASGLGWRNLLSSMHVSIKNLFCDSCRCFGEAVQRPATAIVPSSSGRRTMFMQDAALPCQNTGNICKSLFVQTRASSPAGPRNLAHLQWFGCSHSHSRSNSASPHPSSNHTASQGLQLAGRRFVIMCQARGKHGRLRQPVLNAGERRWKASS